jgi:hypothetical protein
LSLAALVLMLSSVALSLVVLVLMFFSVALSLTALVLMSCTVSVDDGACRNCRSLAACADSDTVAEAVPIALTFADADSAADRQLPHTLS